jgi:Tannase and feruloyl esterase
MRTGLSNLAIGKWIPVAFNQIAPKDADGKPIITQAIADDDRKLIGDALLKQCDAKDGVVDGMISDPLGCDFDPVELTCKEGKTDSCLAPEKVAAIKKAMGGPKTSEGVQVYPGFLYDVGITAGGPIRGILSPGPGIFGPRQYEQRLLTTCKGVQARAADRRGWGMLKRGTRGAFASN